LVIYCLVLLSQNFEKFGEKGRQKHFIKALKLGAKDFITKPFEIRRLLDSVEKSLGYEGIQLKEAATMPNR
jgi:FixJ family two-component response regulator